ARAARLLRDLARGAARHDERGGVAKLVGSVIARAALGATRDAFLRIVGRSGGDRGRRDEARECQRRQQFGVHLEPSVTHGFFWGSFSAPVAERKLRAGGRSYPRAAPPRAARPEASVRDRCRYRERPDVGLEPLGDGLELEHGGIIAADQRLADRRRCGGFAARGCELGLDTVEE